MADLGSTNHDTGWTNFNGVFLGLLLICGFLAVVFLLYFNRIVASVISYLIRTYTWRTSRVHIDIQALQVSLLGGRVFFNGFRYHGPNETILIQNGHITWSYWLWRVKDVNIGSSKKQAKADATGNAVPQAESAQSPNLPCRINVAVSGLEWFVYNRSPVYDSILAGMTDAAEAQDCDATSTEHFGDGTNQPRHRLQKTSQKIEEQLNKLDSNFSLDKKESHDSHGEKRRPHGHGLRESPTSRSDEDGSSLKGDDQLPLMLQLLPIHFECNKAAVVMGNENTKGILVIKTKALDGEITASECPTPDPYRQIFKIHFDEPVIEMKDNQDYKEDQLTRAVKDKQVALDTEPAQHRPFFRRHKRRVMNQLRNMVPYWRSSVESFSVHSRHGTLATEGPVASTYNWQGLSRYLNDDDENDKIRWSSVEYAAVTTLVESPEATLTIYWDVPGKVTRAQREKGASHDKKSGNNVNGSTSPAWAINLAIKGGVVNYGPWADRYRAELQRIFNPTLSKDAVPANPLPVGADRVPTQFKLYVELDEEVTLRIPTREDSKNWRWKKEVADPRQLRKQDPRQGRTQDHDKTTAAQQRPYGWLDVKVGPNATISYSMDMLAGPTGYTNTLNIELPSTEISSSVNHGLLWRSGAQRITCDMSGPLKWNALRQWRFDIAGDDLEVFILRDHIFLLIDLIDDWGTGPPADYLLFTPFKYLLNLEFQNLKLFLNVNDVNIVNNPTDMEENTYLVFESPCLKADTSISLDNFRPSKNFVPFTVQAETIGLALHLPPWNTQASFLNSKQVGTVESLLLSGEYHYNSTTSTANTDTLVLDVTGQSLVTTVHGFIIRYFLQLKDNYFGDYVHFRTLDEYQETLRVKKDSPESEEASRPPHKKSNDLDVVLSIRTDDPKIMLPANIYSSNRHLIIEAAALSVDLRFTNYYMDLDLVVPPLSLSMGSEDDGATSPLSTTSSTQMFIDGLGVYGHRLFGLPPTEPTYLCNWDLSVGTITGECTTDFLGILANAGKSFGFSMDDDENALVPYSSLIVYDVTFLRVSVQSIQLWLHVEEAAFMFSTDAIDVNFNDWARTHYSKRADIKIPSLEIACVNSESAARHKSRLYSRVETDALVRTSIHLSIIGRKHGFSEERRLQQELIRHEDQRTHRTDFLVLPGLLNPEVPDPVDPPAQSVPTVPQPMIPVNPSPEEVSARSIESFQSSRRLRHKSSFLSLSSKSSGSIRRPASNARQRPQDARPGLRQRDVSGSTGRHSAFHSALGDHKDQPFSHNTVAFTSQFFAPYFPLENVRPSVSEAALQSVELGDDDFATSQFGLADIDPDSLREDAVHQSVLIQLPSGVSAFFNTTALRHIASLIDALQPTEPEDMLDTIQVSSMTDIFDEQKQKKLKGSIDDIIVRIPQANVRFLNCSHVESPHPTQPEQDQYDLVLKKAVLATRSDTQIIENENTKKSEDENQSSGADKGDHDNKSESRSSFHLRFDTFEVSAAERLANFNETQAAVKASIEEVMVTLGSKEVTYADCDIGALRLSTSSGKVEYLASLIHRTNILAEEMGGLFSSTLSRGSSRPKQLIHLLVDEGRSAPDAPFMTRPSAVLRAASEHLRTYDSWKLVARLRQMWNHLSVAQKEQLRYECFSSSGVCPKGAREAAIEAFQGWRSWDLENVEDSYLMKNIFGKIATGQSKSAERPQMAVLRVQQVEFLLDPGPKQNQIFAMDITTRFHSKDVETGDAGRDLSAGQIMVANMYCSDAGLNLNWELLELVEDILRLYRQSGLKDTGVTQVQKPDKPKDETGASQLPRTIQFVFSLGHGTILLETVNLRSETQSDDLSISVLMAKRPFVTNTNAVLACSSVSTKLRSHQQSLATFRLKGPSVFVSHELLESDLASTHTIKSTASSQDLRLVVKQDPIVLAEVIDTIVQDELAQLYQLRSQLPSAPAQQPKSHKISERLSSFRVDLAMFLNTYTISLPLLRSITYTISGVVARAAMAANFGKEIIFDFDIKENSHDMQLHVNNAPRSISLLQIPPTNGRVTSRMGHGEHSVSVFASVELIQLDASAVYTLLSALNRPEMANSISDLQRQGKVMQGHMQEIFGSPEETAPKKADPSENKLIYEVHTTLAGIEIFGHSPLRSPATPLAHLSASLGSVHLKLANRLDQHSPILENPEIHVNLRHILFDIRKGTAESMHSCGNLSFAALITASTRETEDGKEKRAFDFRSDSFQVNLSAETVSTFVEVIGYMGDKIKDLDTTKEIEYLQKRLKQSRPKITINDVENEDTGSETDIFDSFLGQIVYSFVVHNIQISWLVNPGTDRLAGHEDLVLSFQKIEFATKKKNTARLTIENFQLQMVPPDHDRIARSANSALLPEVVFNVAFVSTLDTRRLAFQAVGKSLDLRLTSGFIIPGANLIDSISQSIKNVKQASENWTPIVPVAEKPADKPASQPAKAQQKSLFGSKRLESLLIDADFAGAVVHLSGKKPADDMSANVGSNGYPSMYRPALAGKYGQFSTDDSGGTSTTLRSPGLAWKTEYRDDGKDDQAIYGEIKVDASRNILYPTVVPLVMEIVSSIKEVVSQGEGDTPVVPPTPPNKEGSVPKSPEEENILTTDPSEVLGRTKLNVGLRICRQEFSLSCQPIARVAATACFEDIYITANTVNSVEHGNFFAISGTFNKLQASVQHVYSRESTGSFEVDSVVLSLMNSKHFSGTSGVSAILKVSPMKVAVNAKQLQDFLLFREIWVSHETRQGAPTPVATLQTSTSQQSHLVQRYQQVAATAAFPWTATISIAALDVRVDLGQSLGKAVFKITDFWVSSKKTSDWEQNLCLGFQGIGVDCTGRLSGFVTLQNFKLRTSIEWPERQAALNETPRVQASIGFSQFRLKAAFDYQAFLVTDITSMEFLMYNVRQKRDGSADRLVASFDGDAVQVFGTTSSAAQAVALWQAVERLISERKANFESSLRDIEKFLRRKSVTSQAQLPDIRSRKPTDDKAVIKSPISLDTDVVVTLRALNLGVFPSTFSDHQVFKLEALNAQARFAASMQNGRIHSMLGLTLGQLRIGLAGVRRTSAPKAASEISVEDVVALATGSRGGTILKVPKVEAVMQTWQTPESRSIDYIFKSAFEGKVEVGWNYSRISFIRGMLANHSKSLASVWGRDLPEMSAIKVTGVPEAPPSASTEEDGEGVVGGGAAGEATEEDKRKQKQKITAEVHVPQSKYEYVALEPPVIETPQLRDMGEATPPLEWIGLHRERLPNLTHQIVIVSLLELAGEVEDAYGKILGSS
ncbi:Protein CSF1 [Apiospora arundinis]|uniref:Protein CSF1 n=1 Tax=Apiospora arundinis TaxID=335852 RepID=A0ABR2IUX3_9PEZI